MDRNAPYSPGATCRPGHNPPSSHTGWAKVPSSTQAVPADSINSPGNTAPQPTAAQYWSCPPLNTRTVRGKPSAAAASAVNVPSSSPAGRTSARRSTRTPMISSMDASQSPVSRLCMPVIPAAVWSITNLPVKRKFR